jgi:hypothetical protein
MVKIKENHMLLQKKSNESFVQRGKKHLLYFKYLWFHSNQIKLHHKIPYNWLSVLSMILSKARHPHFPKPSKTLSCDLSYMALLIQWLSKEPNNSFLATLNTPQHGQTLNFELQTNHPVCKYFMQKLNTSLN